MSDDEAIWKPIPPDARVLELEEEVDALRANIAGANSRRDQRTAALLSLGFILLVASQGPPMLVVAGLVALGAGVVNWIGRK